MWVIDIRHWLDETQSGPAVPQLRLKVKKLGEIIIYATSSSNWHSGRRSAQMLAKAPEKAVQGDFGN